MNLKIIVSWWHLMIKQVLLAIALVATTGASMAAEEDFAQSNKVFFGDRPFKPEQRAELREIVRKINPLVRSVDMWVQGNQAYKLGEMNRALYYYNLAWWLDQHAVENYRGLVAASLALDNIEEALYVGETALGMDLEDADLWGKVAVAYSLYWHKQDDALMKRAHFFLTKAKRLDSTCKCRYRNEVEALIHMNQHDQAEALYGEASALGIQFPAYFNKWYVEQMAL